MPATSVAADVLEACLLALLILDASKKGTTNVTLLANNASLEVTSIFFGSRRGSYTMFQKCFYMDEAFTPCACVYTHTCHTEFRSYACARNATRGQRRSFSV